ncbi:PLP-dependent transferase [Delitschia confertaspora ATCC 74209]|uniref:PLP-dependent transferase n=1 Tax=Delitschia confertaspora ATCC 74209 TaxID=1513339 RepID=A0A9P4MWQ4_9PLEO|nr:PLP-dependent transferase [Delitschia confertaspora ATCC 74209]
MSTSTTLTERPKVTFGKELREKDFLFDVNWLNLNHGSYGTYPRSIQAQLRSFQSLAESRVDNFKRYTYPKLLDESRHAIAAFVKAPPETIVFVPNASMGVNTVLRNLVFEKGEKILYFSFVYGAVKNTVTYITETTPAEAIKIDVDIPFENDWLVDALKSTIEKEKGKGNRVKVAVFDTVVSVPGIRLPFERMVEVCREERVLSCLDAAHAVGHVELDLGRLDPDFAVSNCHKWLFTPRASALFYVPVRNQHLIRSTLPTSWGFIPLQTPPASSAANAAFLSNFADTGTLDSTPYLCVPAAIKYREQLGGEEKIRSYCQELALEAANVTKEIFGEGTEVLDNETHTLTSCCMSNISLPLSHSSLIALAEEKQLTEALKIKGGLEWVVTEWIRKVCAVECNPAFSVMIYFYREKWWVRWSAQVYLELADFKYSAKELVKVCERAAKGEAFWDAGKDGPSKL